MFFHNFQLCWFNIVFQERDQRSLLFLSLLSLLYSPLKRYSFIKHERVQLTYHFNVLNSNICYKVGNSETKNTSMHCTLITAMQKVKSSI